MGSPCRTAVTSLFVTKQPFKDREVSSPQFWEDLYRQNKSPAWDLGRPTPVFIQWLKENPGLGQSVCVLGAGNGYDAVAFAKRGYAVTAVDFAPAAVQKLQRKARRSQVSMEIMCRDMFSLTEEKQHSFDLVLEYTSYCAIDPRRRDEYVSMVLDLLKPEGRLIALFFPMDQDPAVGPPFGVKYTEVVDRFGPYFHFAAEEWPDLSVKSRRFREYFVIMERRVLPE